jgi:hypothetical protein
LYSIVAAPGLPRERGAIIQSARRAVNLFLAPFTSDWRPFPPSDRLAASPAIATILVPEDESAQVRPAHADIRS